MLENFHLSNSAQPVNHLWNVVWSTGHKHNGVNTILPYYIIETMAGKGTQSNYRYPEMHIYIDMDTRIYTQMQI